MRLLFCTTPLDGHFRPLLPLARSLAARGHDVAFATAASWHAHVEAEGFEALAAGADHAAARGVRLDAGWDAIQELPALDRRPYVFSYLFAQGHAPLKLPALLDAARAWRAQALVYESGDLAAPVVAASLRLPSVNHGFGTMVSLSILERAAPAVAPLWRSAGLEPARTPARSRVSTWTSSRRCSRTSGRSARASGCGSPAASRSIHRRGSSGCRARSSTRPWARSSTDPVVLAARRRARAAGVGALAHRRPQRGSVHARRRSRERPGRAVRAAGAGARLLRGRRLPRRLGHDARRPRRRAAARADPTGRRSVRERGPVRARRRRRRAATGGGHGRARSRPLCGSCSRSRRMRRRPA